MAERALELEEGITAEPKLEGFSGGVVLKTLPSGGSVVVPVLSDHKALQEELDHLCRDLREAEVNLKNQPENSSADGDVAHRQALESIVENLPPEIKEKKNELAISSKNLERWQSDLLSSSEHKKRCDRIENSVEDQLALSYAHAVKLKHKVDGIKHPEEPRSRWRQFVEVVGPVLVVAILTLGALKIWMPGTSASLTGTKKMRVVVTDDRARLDIVVHGHRVLVDLPQGTWSPTQLGDLLNGKAIGDKKLKIISGLKATLPTYLKAEVVNNNLVLSDKTPGANSSIRMIEAKSGGAGRLIGFPPDHAKGRNWYATRQSFMILIGLGVFGSFYIFIMFYRDRTSMKRAVAKYKRDLETAQRTLKDWCRDSVDYVSESAMLRIRIEALLGSIKAIDDSINHVQGVVDTFTEFRSRIEAHMVEESSGVDPNEELPKSRKFFSLMDREEVGNHLLTDDRRKRDEENLVEFSKKWDRPRLWQSFTMTSSLGEWQADLRKNADNSFDFIADFDIGEFLKTDESILAEGCPDAEFLRENATTMAEIRGGNQRDDCIRHVIYNSGTEGGQKGLRDRMSHILLASTPPKFSREGSAWEATIVASRSNIKARRIRFLQSGFQGLLVEPWKDTTKFFDRVGADFDQVYSVVGMTQDPNSAFGGDVRQWYQLISLLPAIMSNDDAKKTAEDGSACLSVAGIRLGKSVSEVLCRVAGYGVSDEEHKRIIEASRARVSSRFLRAVAELERLFNSLPRSDKELHSEWKKVRNDAIDSAYFAFILKACVNERLLKAEGGYFELDGHELTREVTELGAKIDAFRDNKSMPEQLKAEIRGYGQREAASKLPELNAEVYQVLSKNCGKKFLEWVRKHPALPDEESLKGWSDNHPGQWIPPGEATDNEIEDPTDEADRPWT